jgi:zinc transporter 1/2/3
LVGATLPIILSSFLRSKFYLFFSLVFKNFGTGVLLSTALIHLLYHAIILLEHDCLGELAFAPAAPAITMAALLVTFLIDFFAARFLTRHSHESEASDEESASTKGEAISKADIEKPDIDYSSQKAHYEVYILEAGIIFHSIMIGVSLVGRFPSGSSKLRPV